MNDKPSVSSRVLAACKAGVLSGLKTIVFLLRIMIPVSFAVALLKWLGFLPILAKLLGPMMAFLGLPGESALVLISSMLLNNYSAIAVIGSLPLTMREITILALMCLVAHNLIVETAVMKKAGSSAVKMVLLRILGSIAIGWVLNLILPYDEAQRAVVVSTQATQTFLEMLAVWGLSTLKLVVKVVILVLAIMVGQKLIQEFKIMELLSRLLAPVMKLFGLPTEASFLWIIINTVGYAYGAAVVIESVKDGKMKPQDADLFNHHSAMAHSLVEATLLYAAINVSIFWLVVPRLVFAFVVVWLERFRRHWFRRSFKVGTV